MLGDDYSAGSSLNFQCDSGYQLTGPSTVTCKEDTSWSSQLPQCDKVSCGLPTMLENARIDGNAYEFGDSIRFRCKIGYYIVGNPQIAFPQLCNH